MANGEAVRSVWRNMTQRVRHSLIAGALAAGIISQGRTEPTRNEDSPTGTVDVVVAVVGYRSGYRLVTGEYVDGFTTDTNAVENSRGFMFQVLAPTNHARKLLYSHHDGVLPAGNPAHLYQIGKRYRFRVEEKDLLEVHDSGCGCVTATNQEPVEIPPTLSELKGMIEEWNREHANTVKKRASLEHGPGFKRREELLKDLDQRLLYIEKQRAEVESRLAILEGEKETPPQAQGSLTSRQGSAP